ncbi:peptidyl-prolyl cis-trans isomerase [Metabacillus indicus]|uniref:peptidyl-prolyl cis-trans isomerase n=1 Tax=Metabacillus indicus TaxID=246786 RepID=UPI002A028926|nr:peptidyl-prolyl cis-trans isomerase [Metabacillus indicus]MDX8288209.1 peptidyl-prolyl cis-trans isomerase [Metabacillus indicus]
MESIITLTGNVAYPITLDPGVWIFDDRKVDLNTYFEETRDSVDELEEYTKAVSKHWDQEIKEGARMPEERKVSKKEALLNGTFGIPFYPFLQNAKPKADARKVIFSTGEGEIELTLEEASNAVIGFSRNGKPLAGDGPATLYYGDGSNKDNPFKNIKRIIVE